MKRRFALLLFLSSVFVISGCVNRDGPEPTDKKPTFPVKGVVSIDGKPTADVHVYFANAEQLVSDQNTLETTGPGTITDSEGKFSFSTYYADDGLPVGNYALTFCWTNGVVAPIISTNDEPPELDRSAERFNLKYGIPANSEIKFTVEDGKLLDLGTLELTTK